jgi:hypothetical protein
LGSRASMSRRKLWRNPLTAFSRTWYPGTFENPVRGATGDPDPSEKRYICRTTGRPYRRSIPGSFSQLAQSQPRTARKELEYLRAFFAWCQDRKWMSDNPARRLRMPLDEDVATLPFSPEEVGKLIAACDCICSTDPATTPFIRRRPRALAYTFALQRSAHRGRRHAQQVGPS